MACGAALLAPLATGLATTPAAAGGEDPVRFTVAMLNEVDSFNPFLGIEVESYEMWALTYDYLIDFDVDDLSVGPALATSWETSEDGLEWTFTLRDDVTWSDGEVLDAEDVAYTYGEVIDRGPGSATWRSWLSGVTAVEATDPTTVVLTLERPNSVLPMLPIPILPEHVWGDITDEEMRSFAAEPADGRPVVGSGPFRLVEGTAGGSTYRFEANDDYWKGAPHVDELVFRVFKSEDPAVQALIKGEVDYVEGISALQVKALEGRAGVTAQNADTPGFDEISFNAGSVDLDTGEPIGDANPAVLDPAFRFALSLAVDRQQLVDTVYQGAGRTGSTIIPPGYPTFHWEPPAEDLAHDPERAAALLDEAGYTVGADGLRTLPDGSPLGTLRLFARADSSTSTDVMAYFAEWLADLGIVSEVTTVESSKLTDVILAGEFDAFEWGWFVDADPTSMLSYMTCDQRGGWSDSWYCDEEYDALFEQQGSELDAAARAGQIQQMQQILFEDAPYIVTAYNTTGQAVRSDRFACLLNQPAPSGAWLFQLGTHSYRSLRPAAEADDCDGRTTATRAADAETSEGLGTGALVGGGALVVLIAAGVVVALRRRGSVEDRE
ncbi:ABC transporter substrate-binding protein [Nocardioides marinus]|uniref:Peptide/nickel transport system substrate-binding protein n=1 Tax=Nocardioides marinus TaxID=374514 RepID=A0A7Z0C4Z9_9ACTN|nr:peptide/nickel transport system substrate-binding protein [Nocardioides marinus]